eukprot:CAMPEP_0171862388 /NCGR_PEP_ID=MMETSP0992-20121227/27641_1 /TAXON_ID=483369 /ORGANISM="non described non described, Strain CCMP2098" /LENGTH=32 /DNA_ID= /DNA_START= /DNA_END= /DNA_ORIENTATION=
MTQLYGGDDDGDDGDEASSSEGLHTVESTTRR